MFVHEWSKYRYGVFEEHGYPGDPKYPAFYNKVKQYLCSVYYIHII